MNQTFIYQLATTRAVFFQEAWFICARRNRGEKHRIEEPFSVYEQERVIRASLIGSIDPFRWSTIGRPIANRHEQQLFSGCHCSDIRTWKDRRGQRTVFTPRPKSAEFVNCEYRAGLEDLLFSERPANPGIPGERDREIFTFRSLLVRHFQGTTKRSRTGAVTWAAQKPQAL